MILRYRARWAHDEEPSIAQCIFYDLPEEPPLTWTVLKREYDNTTMKYSIHGIFP